MRDNTKSRLIEIGAEIMHLKGFNNTGIKEILQAADVPKGSFYNYFESKEDFGLQVIDYFVDYMAVVAGGVLGDHSVSPLERIRKLLTGFIELFRAKGYGYGCPIGNLSQEMGDLSPAFREKLKYALDSLANTYADALAEPMAIPTYPDITLVRQVRTNYGVAANLEQAITADLGLFARASWSPGQDEIVGWTDVDESASLGVALKGTSWGRPNDTVGVAGVLDGLSAEARAYFAAGGIGILIGDGALNYAPEKIFETYYAYSLNSWSTLTADYQFVDNPAYNADRGPVHIFAGRLHAQF